MQEVLAEPAGKGAGRCPLLRAKRGSFDFFLVQKAHLIIIIIVTKMHTQYYNLIKQDIT